jgi:hypothetical protein
MPLDECESVKVETLLRLLRHARSDMAVAAQRNGSVLVPKTLRKRSKPHHGHGIAKTQRYELCYWRKALTLMLPVLTLR